MASKIQLRKQDLHILLLLVSRGWFSERGEEMDELGNGKGSREVVLLAAVSYF